ncbi:flagellar FlbD family protein [Phytobacter ursingii]|uniref:flagellar FlbD family protein n=1 Tax=Phytobacter ursingii TaxID=1972431 RepID=UPI003CCDF2D4
MFVKLTVLKTIVKDEVTHSPNGIPVFINADHIIRFCKAPHDTIVYLSDGVVLIVKEDNQDIANAISFLVI